MKPNPAVIPQQRTYVLLPGAISFVGGPRFLVQAVGDGEDGDVVVPQPGPDALCLHTMQQHGPPEVHLTAHTSHYTSHY